MTTSPVVSVTDELIAELEAELAAYESSTGSVRGINLHGVRALLTEREELKRTVGRLEARLMLADAYRTSTIATCMAEISATVSKAGDNARDAARLKKLIGWMSSNVPEGWNQVCSIASVATYIDYNEAIAYLDDLEDCSFGLCAPMQS